MSLEVVDAGFHQPLSVVYSRGRHLVGFVAPRCPSHILARWIHQSVGVVYPTDRHLEGLAAPRCPSRTFAQVAHQSADVVNPADRHLEGLAAPRCPTRLLAFLVHQPMGRYPMGRHLECLSATRCPSGLSFACLGASWGPWVGWALQCNCCVLQVWPGSSESCVRTLNVGYCVRK